jgi:hypothetical protein
MKPRAWGENPPVDKRSSALNGRGSHGHELAAGLAGWFALRRRAMNVVRLYCLDPNSSPPAISLPPNHWR